MVICSVPFVLRGLRRSTATVRYRPRGAATDARLPPRHVGPHILDEIFGRGLYDVPAPVGPRSREAGSHCGCSTSARTSACSGHGRCGVAGCAGHRGRGRPGQRRAASPHDRDRRSRTALDPPAGRGRRGRWPGRLQAASSPSRISAVTARSPRPATSAADGRGGPREDRHRGRRVADLQRSPPGDRGRPRARPRVPPARLPGRRPGDRRGGCAARRRLPHERDRWRARGRGMLWAWRVSAPQASS